MNGELKAFDRLRRLFLVLSLVVGVASILGSGGGTPDAQGCEVFNQCPPSLSIRQQPADVTARDGEAATFDIVVESVAISPATVEWQSCDAGVALQDCTWNTLNPGAPSFAHTLGPVTLADNGTRVRAIVRARQRHFDSHLESRVATLTVLPALAPTITASPIGTTVAEGQGATFTVTATGTALQYQWERSDDASSPFAPIPGATNVSYTLTNARFALAPAGDNGARFRVVVSNSGGSVTSDPPAQLSVTPVAHPPVITQDPKSVSVTDGTTVNFLVASTGTPPLAYQWRKNGASVGGNASSLSFTATLADNAALIDVIVSNAMGSATSNAAVLTVSQAAVAPAITTPPQDVAVGVGKTATFSVVASGTNLAYQWQRSDDGGASFAAAPGVNGQPDYQIAGVQLADNGARLRVVVANSAGSVTSHAALLSVTAFPASAVAAGTSCSFSLNASTGQVFSWGTDQEECLGNGAGISSQSSPVPLAGIADAVQLAAGPYGYHSLVVRSNGEVWSWGYDIYGQLGIGRTSTGPATQPLPVRMTTAAAGNPPVANAIATARGSYHSLVLLADGTVMAVGFNLNGQLGDGTNLQRSRAVAVQGLTGVTAIAAGDRFSLALRNDGSVWAWGTNLQGQLGDGSTVTRSLTPVKVSGLSNVVAISAGVEFSLALDANGDVWAWGRNDQGQLGDGSGLASRNVPGKVALSGASAIGAGYKHAMAVLAGDGSVMAWGANLSGQLGVGDRIGRPSPTLVSGLPRMASVAPGFAHTLAIDGARNVWAWGDNTGGALGLGSLAPGPTTPQQLPGLP